MKKVFGTILFTLTMSFIFLNPISAQLNSPICPIWGPNVNKVDETSAVIQYKMKNPFYPYNFTIHEILLDGLQPNTSYSYSLFSDSEEYTFQTAPSDGAPQSFSFGFYGDNRGTRETTEVTPTYYSIISDMQKHNPDFIIEAGDLIEAGDGKRPELRETQWDNFRIVRDGAQHEIPMYAAIGNHDDPDNLAPISFEDIFAHWGNERYYSFDYGFSHFSILNPLEDNYQIKGEQLKWLQNDLASSNAVYKFVVSHYAYISRWDPGRGLLGFADLVGTTDNAEELWEILENNSITAFLASHDHLYDRILIGDRNITQAVVAGGGATLYIPSSRQLDPDTGEPVLFNGKPSYSAYGYGYSVINVEWDRVWIDAYGLGNLSVQYEEGVKFDTFEFPTPYNLVGAISIATSHFPITPTVGESLEVTTTLTGVTSPVSVTLFYSKDGLFWENAPMTLDQDHYEYNITGIQNNSELQYYVLANDSLNNRGLSEPQSIILGSLAGTAEPIPLGALINNSGCTPYSMIPTTTTTTQPTTSSTPWFLQISILSGVILLIIRKRSKG